jgi:hypothetical protein
MKWILFVGAIALYPHVRYTPPPPNDAPAAVLVTELVCEYNNPDSVSPHKTARRQSFPICVSNSLVHPVAAGVHPVSLVYQIMAGDDPEVSSLSKKVGVPV